MSSEEKEHVVKAFLYNKKEDYQRVLDQSGSDYWRQEVDQMVEGIPRARDEMYDRRKRIDGFGLIYAEGKVVDLLNELFDCYVLGKYYATIALCGMAAERMCYDYLDYSDIKINNKTLSEIEKEELYNIQYIKLLDFLLKIGILDVKSRTILAKINDIRNRHVHPKMKGADVDSLEIINLLCHVLEDRLSISKFYDVVNGKLKRKS